jgi:hypothetical protein
MGAPGPRSRLLLALGGLLVASPLLPSRLGRTQTPLPSPAGEALLQVRGDDPLRLSRLVARCGDHAILSLLGAGQPGAVRLAAIGASRFLLAPESALGDLSELIGSRDSLLAPAAARAAVQIASGLDAEALSRREASTEQLGAVLLHLRKVAEMARVRGELRMMATVTADLLVAAGVPHR